MRRKGIEQQQQRLIFGSIDALVIESIHKAHHCRNGCIVLERLNVLADLFNRLMNQNLMLFRICTARLHLIEQVPDTLQETAAALDGR